MQAEDVTQAGNIGRPFESILVNPPSARPPFLTLIGME
jgi:hypothetical protein